MDYLGDNFLPVNGNDHGYFELPISKDVMAWI
jgi:hypothetical protein